EMDACFEAMNLSSPETLLKIHRDYIDAGARLIETNTYGANRYKLADYGLGDKVIEVNTAAGNLVKQAIQESGCEDVYIAGSIGPLSRRMRPYGRISREEVQETFGEQIRALVAAGVDAILLETFTDHAEILAALEAARDVAPGT